MQLTRRQCGWRSGRGSSCSKMSPTSKRGRRAASTFTGCAVTHQRLLAVRDGLSSLFLSKALQRVKEGFEVEKQWRESRRLVLLCHVFLVLLSPLPPFPIRFCHFRVTDAFALSASFKNSSNVARHSRVCGCLTLPVNADLHPLQPSVIPCFCKSDMFIPNLLGAPCRSFCSRFR